MDYSKTVQKAEAIRKVERYRDSLPEDHPDKNRALPTNEREWQLFEKTRQYFKMH